MNNSVLVTTTNSIENAKIVKYIDLISTNVVVGTNIFSDFGASLTDIFGGYSNIYQNKLQGIYKTAINNLRQKATTAGANAIVGLKIDFDEVSGKGKSMFMVSAFGTAVLLSYDEKNKSLISNNEKSSIVEADELEKELIKIQIKRSILSSVLPNNEQWMHLLNNPNDDIVLNLLDEYIKIDNTDINETQSLLLNHFSAFLSISDNTIVVDALYSKITTNFNVIYSLINSLKIFSPKHVQELIASDNLYEAISCLSILKSCYSADDLADMNQIIIQLSNLPDKGKIDIVKGLLSKSKEKYICPCGHNSNATDKYCSNFDCGQNIKGLTEDQVNAIESFKEKVNTLSILLSK